MEEQNEILELSPKIYSGIEYLKKQINWEYKIENNNVYLEENTDFKNIKSNLEKYLDDLWFKNYKIDQIDFLNKHIIIISFIEESKEEYIKIFFKSNLKEDIKYYINKILW